MHASCSGPRARALAHFRRIERTFTSARARFVGKCSPVLLLGGFDLAVTRFSGRRAPPREGPAFMREACSHEVISHGFWPGSGPMQSPAFYACAVPAPPGFDAIPVKPAAAFITRSSESSSCRMKPSGPRTIRIARCANSSTARSARRDAGRLGSRGARSGFTVGRVLDPSRSRYAVTQ